MLCTTDIHSKINTTYVERHCHPNSTHSALMHITYSIVLQICNILHSTFYILHSTFYILQIWRKDRGNIFIRNTSRYCPIFSHRCITHTNRDHINTINAKSEMLFLKYIYQDTATTITKTQLTHFLCTHMHTLKITYTHINISTSSQPQPEYTAPLWKSSLLILNHILGKLLPFKFTFFWLCQGESLSLVLVCLLTPL